MPPTPNSNKKPRRRPNPNSSKVQEKLVADGIKQVLSLSGALFWKNWGNPFMPPGIPDFVGLIPVNIRSLLDRGVETIGVFFGIEVKAPGKIPPDNASRQLTKTETAQLEFLYQINRRNGIGVFCDSPTELIAMFQERGIPLLHQARLSINQLRPPRPLKPQPKTHLTPIDSGTKKRYQKR